MKHFRIFLVLAFVLAALGAQSGQVGAMKFSYTSGYQVQNLANSPATITLTYYNAQTSDTNGTGTVATSTDVSIAALGSATYIPIHAAAGFKGSVVISSSTPVASIANLHAVEGTTKTGNAAYVGKTTGALEVNLPLLHKGNYGFDSWFSVQNAGTGNANVSVAYSDGTSVGPVVIKPGASYTFDQMNETHTKAVFSAKVTSNQPVIAVVVQERLFTPTGAATMKQSLAYTGFDAGETSAVMPLVNVNNYGFTTGIQIQNTGNQASTITLSYTPTVSGTTTIGTACTETRVVPANSSVTFALSVFAGKAPTAPDSTTCKNERFVGSARITANSANMPVVAIVNQQTAKSASAYGSFMASRATSKVVLPLVMDRNYGWSTAFNLMNVGNNTVNVSCTFTNTGVTVTGTLAPGAALNANQKNKIADRYVGSGTCTATPAAGQTGPALIAAVVNEDTPDVYDALLTYEAINVP